MLGKLVVVALVFGVQSHIDEKFYGTVHNGRLTHTNYKPMLFEKHPQNHGTHANNWPALKLDGRDAFFGQAYQDDTGAYCAKFYIRGEYQSTCNGFRIFVHYDPQPFYLVKVRNFNFQIDDRVEYGDNVLALVRDDEDSSFFGTYNLRDATVTYVDYRNVPHTYKVRPVDVKEDVLFVVAPKH